MIAVIENISLKCAGAPTCMYQIRALTASVHLLVALAGHAGGNLGCGDLKAYVVKHAVIAKNHQQFLPTH
jgi:hypothetical protein